MSYANAKARRDGLQVMGGSIVLLAVASYQWVTGGWPSGWAFFYVIPVLPVVMAAAAAGICGGVYQIVTGNFVNEKDRREAADVDAMSPLFKYLNQDVERAKVFAGLFSKLHISGQKALSKVVKDSSEDKTARIYLEVKGASAERLDRLAYLLNEGHDLDIE